MALTGKQQTKIARNIKTFIANLANDEVIAAGTANVPLAQTVAGSFAAVYLTQSAITGTNRPLVVDSKLTGAITTLSHCSIRGHAQLSGGNTIGGGAYIYGMQGKFTLGGGRINHADSRVCGLMAQLDVSSGTYTTGQISALWVDCGASGNPGVGDGQANIVRISNTTAWKPNAVIYAYATSSFLLDISGPGGSVDWKDATAHGTTEAGRLKIKVHGDTRYLHVFSD